MAKFHGVGVGVGVLCVDEETNTVLVGIRKGSHGAQTYALPGGHLELNETWEECARRELMEETGLSLQPQQMTHIYTSNDRMENNKHYITIFMMGKIIPGTQPVNTEPDKCEGWVFRKWEDLENLPLFPPLEALTTFSPRKPWVQHHLQIPKAWCLVALVLVGTMTSVHFYSCKLSR